LFALFHYVENQFHSIGNAQLIVDAKQIVAYRVFTEAELTGNVPVGKTLSHKADHLRFSFSQQVESLSAYYPGGGSLD
jgi:hypothetical protein